MKYNNIATIGIIQVDTNAVDTNAVDTNAVDTNAVDTTSVTDSSDIISMFDNYISFKFNTCVEGVIESYFDTCIVVVNISELYFNKVLKDFKLERGYFYTNASSTNASSTNDNSTNDNSSNDGSNEWICNGISCKCPLNESILETASERIHSNIEKYHCKLGETLSERDIVKHSILDYGGFHSHRIRQIINHRS